MGKRALAGMLLKVAWFDFIEVAVSRHLSSTGAIRLYTGKPADDQRPRGGE